jgi:hypothetical protein
MSLTGSETSYIWIYLTNFLPRDKISFHFQSHLKLWLLFLCLMFTLYISLNVGSRCFWWPSCECGRIKVFWRRCFNRGSFWPSVCARNHFGVNETIVCRETDFNGILDWGYLRFHSLLSLIEYISKVEVFWY